MTGDHREPGWYPDRNDPDSLRWWNGRAWTARRAPANGPIPPPRPDREPVAPATSAPSPQPRSKRPIFMWVVGGLLLVRAAASLMAVVHPADVTAVHPTPSASSSSAPTAH